jgi:hypothetical protein
VYPVAVEITEMKRTLPGLSGLAIAAAIASLASAGCQQPVSLVGVLATGEQGVTSVAVDDFFVYWATLDGKIRKVPVDGGPVQTVATAQSGADNLVVDETHLVWSTGESLSAFTKATGALNTFPAVGTVQRVTMDPQSVYWTVSSGEVNTAWKSGAQFHALATKQTSPVAISVGAAMVYWANAAGGGAGPGTVGDGDPTNLPAEAVYSVDSAGGITTAVLPTQDNPVALLTDEAHLYWGNQGDSTNGTVSIAALDGTSPVTLAINVAQLHALVADGITVYYSTLDGTVSSVPVTGAAWMTVPADGTGTPGEDPYVMSVQMGTPLVLGPAGIVSLASDATNLYWANQGDPSGAILTMPKL